MSDNADEPTQTTPEGEEREELGLPGQGGTHLPMPSKAEFMRNLRKVAPTADPESDKSD